MDRRRFLLTSVAGALAAPVAVETQQAGKVWRIGILGVISDPVDKAFEDSLTRLGHSKDRDFTIVGGRRSYHPTPQAAAEAVADLLRSNPDLIVAWGTVGAVATKKAGTQVPVVFLSVGVPVEIGLVSSLSRPGGNMTGVTFEAATETYAKRLQLLKEIVPRLSRVAVLYAVGDPNADHAFKSAQGAAPSLGVQLRLVPVQGPGDLESAFAAMKTAGADGVLVVAGALTFTSGGRIAALALANRLPSSHAFRETVEAGGLVSLGPNYVDMATQGARYVSKVMNGAKPNELPVEQPTRYDLVINGKTAKALGLTIPPSLLARADQIIE